MPTEQLKADLSESHDMLMGGRIDEFGATSIYLEATLTVGN